LAIFLLVLMAPSLAWAQAHGLPQGLPQGLFDAPQGQLPAAGWAGFLDKRFMIDAIGALLIATGLSALIAYHQNSPRTVDTLSEADMPRVYILYAFVGAVIGVTVREFGMVIG